MDKQRCTKHTQKTKERVTWTPLKSGGEGTNQSIAEYLNSIFTSTGCLPFLADMQSNNCHKNSYMGRRQVYIHLYINVVKLPILRFLGDYFFSLYEIPTITKMTNSSVSNDFYLYIYEVSLWSRNNSICYHYLQGLAEIKLLQN